MKDFQFSLGILGIIALASCSCGPEGAIQFERSTSALWTQRTTSGRNPGPRADLAMAHHAPSGKTLIGSGTSDPEQWWTWDGAGYGQSLSGPVAARDSTRMVAAERGDIFVFGGHITERPSGNVRYFNDAYLYTGSGGFQSVTVSPGTELPPERTGHAMAYDPDVGVLVYGGTGHDMNGAPVVLGDFWVFGGGRWTQLASDPRIGARTHAALAYDPISRTTLLFGGSPAGSPTRYLGDTWSYDSRMMRWTSVNSASSPEPRAGHGMVFDSTERKIFLYGGENRAGIFDDTWVFDVTTQMWMAYEPHALAGPRAFFGFAYDSTRLKTIVYGGKTSATRTTSNELWELTPTGSMATNLALVSGDMQTSTVAGTLRAPLLVRLADEGGRRIPRVGVTFIAVGGTVNPSETFTDSDGQARARFTCAEMPGTAMVTAQAEGIPPVVFMANCTAGLLSTLELELSPDRAKTMESVTATIRGKDRFGNGVTTYGGTLNFSTDAPNATVPERRDFTPGESQIEVRGLFFGTAGTWTVTVKDAASGGAIQASDTVEIIPRVEEDPPPVLELEVKSPDGQRRTGNELEVTVDEGDVLNVLVRATDQNDLIDLSSSAIPKGVSFEKPPVTAGINQQDLFWTPKVGDAGRYVIEFEAKDRAEQKASAKLKVNVRGSYYGCTDVRVKGRTAPFLGLALAFVTLMARGRRRRLSLVILALVALESAPAQADDDLFSDDSTVKRPEQKETTVLQSIVFLGLASTSSVAEEAVDPVSEHIQQQLEASGVYRVIDAQQARDAVRSASEGRATGVTADARILHRVGEKLGVSRLLRGEIEASGGYLFLKLTLLEVSDARVLAESARRVVARFGKTALMSISRPVLIDLILKDPDPVVVKKGRELRLDGWDRPSGLYLDIIGRVEGDVLGKGIAGAVAVSLGNQFFGGTAAVILVKPNDSRPFAIRLEGRIHPIVLGYFRPYAAAGTTAFLPDFGLRAAAGTEFRRRGLVLTADAAFEWFPHTASIRLPTALVISLGGGLGL